MAENKKKSFEESLSRLEEIVGQLEDEGLSLEESMKLYEEGVKCANECSEKLKRAERKILILQGKSDGGVEETPVDLKASD